MMARTITMKRAFIGFNIVLFVVIGLYVTNERYKPKAFKESFFRLWSQEPNSSQGIFPDTFPCYYTQLRKLVDNETKQEIGCKPYKPDKNSCKKINTYFGSPREPPVNRECPGKHYDDICWFDKESKLVCSSKVCGRSTISMGRRDTKLGHITTWNPINPFSTENALAFVKDTLKEGDTFCFLKCGSILQALTFPPDLFIKTTEKSIKNKININVVILDSISRPHFYRTMKRSVRALREVIYDNSIPATALDFELFQSIGTSTFENMRGFFSGFYVDNKAYGGKQTDQPVIGFNVMYEHFKKQGYQTALQEDLCWYDSWGTLLGNIKVTGTSTPTAERWAKYKENVSKYFIDHFGNTHFSCQVLKQYGKTNPFGDPDKVCLNGQFYSSYFLRFVKQMSNAARFSKKVAPFVSYIHLATGHSETGKRISNIDKVIADYIYHFARDPLTWTFIFGDHGHRRTNFARSTTSGDYERYNPLSFMVVPDKVSEILGANAMMNLFTNQNRLVTVLDLHKAVMSINDQQKLESNDPDISGVLGKLSANRSCSDLPLMPLVKCQCVGSEDKYEDNAPKLQWVAEFALGTVNNDIQAQYSQGTGGKQVKGFGNCKRYVGASFRNIIQTNSGNLIRMDIYAKPYGLDKEENFKVAVAIEDNKAVFKSFERQSTYNIYKDCVDKTVNVKMCSCKRSQPLTGSSGTHRLTLGEMKNLVQMPMFGRKPEVKTLYGDCLLQVTRNYFDSTIVVEVANACVDKTFNVRVGGDISNIFLSRKLPMNDVVPPNTITFIYVSTKQSVTHFTRKINIVASIV